MSWLHVRGGEMTQNEWQNGDLRTLGILFGNRNNTAHRLLFLLNAGDEAQDFVIPAAPPGAPWGCRFDTAREDVEIRALNVAREYKLVAHSAALLEC